MKLSQFSSLVHRLFSDNLIFSTLITSKSRNKIKLRESYLVHPVSQIHCTNNMAGACINNNSGPSMTRLFRDLAVLLRIHEARMTQTLLDDPNVSVEEKQNLLRREIFEFLDSSCHLRGAIDDSLVERTLQRLYSRSHVGQPGTKDKQERFSLLCKLVKEQRSRSKILMEKLQRLEDVRHFFTSLRLRKYEMHVDDLQSEVDSILSRQLAEDLAHTVPKANAIYSSIFGQPFVVDLGLPYKMQAGEVTSFYRQMKDLYFSNLLLPEPFKLILANFDPNDKVMAGLMEAFPDFLWEVRQECFTALFSNERLVYMSPDSPHPVQHACGDSFRFDDVFIVGACVDAFHPTPVTWPKIQRLGIRSCKLNTDALFNLAKPKAPGYKTRHVVPFLALCDVFRVIADGRESEGNWKLAHRNLITGRKKVFEWKEEADDMAKEIADFRIKRILQGLEQSAFTG